MPLFSPFAQIPSMRSFTLHLVYPDAAALNIAEAVFVFSLQLYAGTAREVNLLCAAYGAEVQNKKYGISYQENNS